MDASFGDRSGQTPWFSIWRTPDSWAAHGLEFMVFLLAVMAFMACGFYIFDFLMLHSLFPAIAVWDTQIAILFGGFVTTLILYTLLNRLRISFQRLRSEVEEREKVEAALRRSEERYRLLFQEANDALFLLELDPGGKVTRYREVNAVACEMLGYTREELLRASPFDIVAPELHERMAVDLQTLVEDRKLVFERTLIARDGTRVPVEVSTRLFEHRGRPTLLSIARDLSRRREAEEALRQSEENYRRLSQEFQALLNAITDSLVLLSPDLKVLWANKCQACCPSGQVCSTIGHHCYGLCKGRSSPCEDCPALKSFQSGRVESRVSINEGRYLNARAFPILDEGTIHSVIMVISDITEKMTLQAEALQAGHLAALGELAAGVAHEINNPINGIINYAQILINKSADGSLEQDVAGRILKESERISNIVSSLLAFARPNRDQRRPVSIPAVLSEALNLTQAQMRTEGVRIKLEVPPDLPTVSGNFQQIQQVFLNILNNARHALNEKYPGMHEDKLLEISGEASAEGGVERVGITFHDRGIGMSDEVVSRVVQPFYSTKPEGKGTGLGLTISERIVRDHGGSLKIASVEGDYTRVTVELPVGREHAG